MRLATEYQQKNNKKSQLQDNGRKYIVRLGRGTPQDEGRKRGISLSKQSQKLQKQSIGRHQVSQQKMRQQQQSQLKTSNSNHKITSTACYSTKPEIQTSNYAAQHLVFSNKNYPQPREASRQLSRHIPAARSQQGFFTRSPQTYFNPTPITIKTVNFQREVYIPIKQAPQPQYQPRNISLSRKVPQQINQKNKNIYQPTNIITLQHSKHQLPQQQILYYSNSIQKNSKISTTPLQQQQKNRITIKPDSPAMPKVTIKIESPTYQVIQQKQNQKMIASKQDPYNLTNSKLTKRIGQSPEQPKEEQLFKTKKRLRELTECRQLSNSNSNENSISIESHKQGINRGIKSLWDANKVESIFSMKQSQSVKFQQSQIMIDYFNPKQHLQRRR